MRAEMKNSADIWKRRKYMLKANAFTNSVG